MVTTGKLPQMLRAKLMDSHLDTVFIIYGLLGIDEERGTCDETNVPSKLCVCACTHKP